MQRVEYSMVRRGRAEHDGDENDECGGGEVADRQVLVVDADADIDHGETSDNLKDQQLISIADPEGKGKREQTEKTPHKQSKRGPVVFLNGLRGLAALMVVQQHLQYTPEIRLGSASVDVFFVLSAFLLTMLFERKARQMLAQRATVVQWGAMLADYFSKRFFRVYPLLVVLAVVLKFLSRKDLKRYFFVETPTYSALDVITFKFEARYFVFWTLPLEIAYYFLIPVFVAAILALRRHWWLLALPIYAWSIHEGIHKRRWHHQPLRPHLPTFIVGSLAAVVYSKIDQWIKAHNFEFPRWQRVLVRVFELAVFSLLMSILFRGLLFHWVITNPYLKVEGFPFVSVPVSALIVIEMLLPSALSRFLEWNFLCYAGKISFSIYMLHTFVIHFPAIHSQPYVYDRFLLNIGGTMLLATVSYWAVEYPSQLVSQRISKALSRVGAQAAPLALQTV